MHSLTFSLIFYLFHNIPDSLHEQNNCHGIQKSNGNNMEPKHTWGGANDYCQKQNDSLVRIHDLNISRHLGLPPVWSSLRGEFTPWIAYKGCYHYNPSSFKGWTNQTIKQNTVGKCYKTCQEKPPIDCKTERLYLGLKVSECICFCYPPVYLSTSQNCNMSCEPSSLDDGECGGYGYLSLYEEFLDSSENFSGLCLICTTNFQEPPTLHSWECDNPAFGFCNTTDVENSKNIKNASVILGNMSLYWTFCNSKNQPISTDLYGFCIETPTWTGLRKYKIDKEDTCYFIDVLRSSFFYLKKDCNEQVPFICRNSLAANMQSSTLISTTTGIFDTYTKYPFTTLSSEYKVSAVSQPLSTGAVIGIVGGLFITAIFATIFLVWHCRKTRQGDNNLQNIQSNEQPPAHLNNAYYSITPCPDVDCKLDDHQKSASCQMDNIYLDNREDEYDHLHSRRQRKATSPVDEDRYGTATHWEDSQTYSSAGQERRTVPDLENEYSSIVPSLESFNNPDYDHCAQLQRPTDW